MRRIATTAILAAGFLAAAVYAGTGYMMKCQAGPDGQAQVKPCGYQARVTFGGGMFFEQVTGYCRACKKFVSLTWTRPNLPPQVKPRIQPKPRPKPLGEVWDGRTGRVLTVYACPHCRGPFVEIQGPEDLKYCPACNGPHFGIDKDAPVMAID